MADRLPIRFFTVLLKQEQLHHLSMPERFVLDYGHLLSSGSSYLRLPSSTLSWDVELIKKKNGAAACFRRRWPEFCKRFSLALGMFIVFKYLGDNKFDLVILDTSGTEIDYWMDEVLVIESDDTSSENTLESSDDCVIIDNEEEEECLNIDTEEEEEEENEKLRPPCLAEPYGDKGKKKATTTDARTPFAAEKHSNPADNAPADSSCGCEGRLKKQKFQKAMKQWAKDHFIKHPSFLVCMNTSYVKPATYMHIPVYHSHVYLKNMDAENVHVVLSLKNKQKTWDVKCGSDNKTGNPRFGAGWAAFVKDNNITTTDVCVFELVDLKTRWYRVTIRHFRDECNHVV